MRTLGIALVLIGVAGLSLLAARAIAHKAADRAAFGDD